MSYNIIRISCKGVAITIGALAKSYASVKPETMITAPSSVKPETTITSSGASKPDTQVTMTIGKSLDTWIGVVVIVQ